VPVFGRRRALDASLTTPLARPETPLTSEARVGRSCSTV
jgi:hypothetical protein